MTTPPENTLREQIEEILDGFHASCFVKGSDVGIDRLDFERHLDRLTTLITKLVEEEKGKCWEEIAKRCVCDCHNDPKNYCCFRCQKNHPLLTSITKKEV